MAKRKNTVIYIEGMNLLLPYDDQRTGRSSPLRFVLFRCPGDTTPEGQLYRMKRESLKLKPDGMAMLGIYDELLIAYGGNKIAALRGFLVNHHLQAASYAELGQAIGCRSTRTMMSAVRRLLAAGLLMEVERPDFEAAIKNDKTIEVIPRPPCPTREQRQKKKKKPDKFDDTQDQANDSANADEANANDPAQVGEAEDNGENNHVRKPTLPADGMAAGAPPGSVPEDSGKIPEKEGVTLDTRQGDVRRADKTQPKTAAAAPPPPSANGYGETQDKKLPATAAPLPDAGRTPDKTQTTASPSRSTLGQRAHTDRPTDNQQTADDDAATGNQHNADATQATHSATQQTAEPTKPTEADPGQKSPTARRRSGEDMSWHAESFAQQVMDTLYPTREDIVIQGRLAQSGPQGPDEFEAREMGCFRHAFADALQLLDQVGAMKLLTWSLQEAQKTHKVKCRYTRGQWWRCRFGKHMAKIRRQQADASGPP